MHARTFLCREALWEAFEEMAREQRAPIDEVLSEAMRAYARQRSYGGPSGEEPRAGHPPGQDHHAGDASDLARTGAIRQSTQRMAPLSADGSMRRPPSRPPAPRSLTQPIGQTLPAPPPSRGGARFPGGAPLAPPPPRGLAPPPRAHPPPLPLPEPYVPASNPYARARAATSLSLTYQNQSFEVTKERFLLGRSKSQADLVLDDANVSRQHAAIERVGDTWVLADLGSTNGCYVEGQRVSRRQIVDGDVIEITTHQIRCTLR